MNTNLFNLVFANFILIKGKVVSPATVTVATVTWDVAALEEQEYEHSNIKVKTRTPYSASVLERTISYKALLNVVTSFKEIVINFYQAQDFIRD